MQLNSDEASATSNHDYFRAQPPAYLCSMKTEPTIRTKWSNTFICSGIVLKFVQLRRNCILTVLNLGYKFDLLQLKQDVFWLLTYSRSETNAWKISLEVMKFVYFDTTNVLSVLILGLNITYTKFWILWICPRPTSYLYPISTQNMTLAKRLNTSIAYELLGTFIRPVRHEEKATQERYGYDMLQLWQVFSSSHFRHQVPPYMQSRQGA